jgi:Homing endonuclease associated repeat
MGVTQNTSISKIAVIEELRRVYFGYFENTRMIIEKFSLHSKISYSIVKKHFGSWENALNKAEINCNPRANFSEEKVIIATLRQVYFQHFENTRMEFKDFRLHSKISFKTVLRHFVSWENALTQAKINCKPKTIQFDKKTIVLALRSVYFDHFENTRMTWSNFRKFSKISYARIKKHFDSWENALDYAEINCISKGIQYDKPTIITALRAVYFDHFENTKMTFLHFSKHSQISLYFVIKHFDSWENALNEAEIYSFSSIKEYQEKTIIKELRRVYFDHFEDTTMSFKDFHVHSKMGIKLIIKIFGTWLNALKQAELNCSKRSSHDKESIITELKRVYFEYFENTRMTIENYRLHSKISYQIVIKHFGSWENALNKAQINCRPKIIQIDKQIIIATLRQVYFQYFENTRMTIENYRLHSKISYDTVIKYFDSWENALNQAQINCMPSIDPNEKENIVLEIKRIYFDHFKNTTMSFENFRKHNKIGYKIITKHFGSWKNALIHSEIANVPKPKLYDKKTVIAELQRVYLEHFENTRMTALNFCKHSKISYYDVKCHFGSWENALNQVEIKGVPSINLTIENNIIATMRQVYFDYFENTRMSYKNFRKHSKISYRAIIKYFDTWENAINKAEINCESKPLRFDTKTIIAELKRVRSNFFENTRMTIENFELHSKISRSTVMRSFGSWDNALNQAEINCIATRPPLYNKNEIIAELQRVYFAYFENTRMTTVNFSKHSKIGFKSIFKQFDSWENALNQAQINYTGKTIKSDKKAVIAALRRVYLKYYENTQMTFENFSLHTKMSLSDVYKHFDSWESALNQAEINFIQQMVTPKKKREQVLVDLQNIKAQTQGVYFSYDFYKENNGRHSRIEIFALFECDKWDVLLERQLRIYRKNKTPLEETMPYTEKQLFAELKRFWKKLGRRPTYQEFRKDAFINIGVYEKKFKSWTLCVEKFCAKNKGYALYENSRNSLTSKTELLDELKKMKKKHPSQTLSYREYKELGGKQAIITFKDFFGSWQIALQSAGLKPKQDRGNIPDSVLLLKELQNIIEKLGKKPTRHNIDELGKYPFKYYKYKFGSVKNSLVALSDRLVTADL